MAVPERLGGEHALTDLKQVVEGALRTNGALLTAGERVICQRIGALEGASGRVYARLAGRSGELFRVDQLRYEGAVEGIDGLVSCGLVHEGIPWSQRMACFTVEELKGACRRLGLRVGGKRAELEERLAGQAGWSDARVVRVTHKALIRRLELLWFRSPWRDRSVMVLERLGHFQPARYEVGGGGRAFATRAALMAYEAARVADLEPEEALDQAEKHPPRPAHLRRLDTRRVLGSRALERTRELEREGSDRVEGLYRRALALEIDCGFAAWRLAQVLDRAGRAREGAALCDRWRERVLPTEALQLERTGRRLARKAGMLWRPMRPFEKAPLRHVRLEAAERLGNRPGWGRGVLIEQACMEALAPRRVLFAENLLWTTLFGLLFADLYFLPVEGMLPAPFLFGPLDLGTSEFRLRRRQVEDRLDAIRAGEGLPILRRNRAEREGQSISGLAWEAWTPEDLEAVCLGIGPAAASICERLLDEGWRAARGLPDLCILPGEACPIDGIPATVGEGLLLVEVKGPTDAMRDDQRIWHDRLLRAGIGVEVWSVTAT